MPIEHSSGGTIITGDAIDYFALCVHKGAVGLEINGIKVSRGPVRWKQYRDHYQIPKLSAKTGKPIKGQANKHDVYRWLCAKVAELRPQQTHISTDPATGREVVEVEGREVN